MFIGHARANLWAAGEFMLDLDRRSIGRDSIGNNDRTLRSALPILDEETLLEKKKWQFFEDVPLGLDF